MAGLTTSDATESIDAAEQSKHSERRATIRDTAARVFAVRGYHGASVKEVADSLGINKATLYHYYRSKEQILFDILTFADKEVNNLLENEVRSGHLALTLIGRVVAVHVTWYLQHPAIARVAFRDWNELSGDDLAEQVERRRRYSHFLRNTIEMCRDEGVISPETNVGLVANFINGAVAATNVWFDPNGADTPEEVGQAFGKMAAAIIVAARKGRDRRILKVWAFDRGISMSACNAGRTRASAWARHFLRHHAVGDVHFNRTTTAI